MKIIVTLCLTILAIAVVPVWPQADFRPSVPKTWNEAKRKTGPHLWLESMSVRLRYRPVNIMRCRSTISGPIPSTCRSTSRRVIGKCYRKLVPSLSSKSKG